MFTDLSILCKIPDFYLVLKKENLAKQGPLLPPLEQVAVPTKDTGLWLAPA